MSYRILFNISVLILSLVFILLVGNLYQSFLLFSGVVVIILAKKVEPEIFSPLWIIVAYFFVYYLMRPMYISIFGANYFSQYGSIDLNDIFMVGTYSLFFMILLIGGYNIGRNVKQPKKSFAYSSYYFNVAGWGVIIISILSYSLLIVMLGGLTSVLNTHASLVKDIADQGKGALLLWSLFNYYFLGLGLILCYAVEYRKRLYKVALILFFGIFLAVLLGRRSAILFMLLPILGYYHFYVKRITLAKASASGATILLGFAAILFFRVTTSANAASDSFLEVFFLSAELFTWDIQAEVFRDLMRDEVDYRYGLDFIPRFLRELMGNDSYLRFPSLGNALVHEYFPIFQAGIPPGLIGASALNFGVFGVFVGFFVGFVFGYSTSQMLVKSPPIKLIIFPQVIALAFFLMRLGDVWLAFNAYLRPLILSFLFIIFIHTLYRDKYSNGHFKRR